MSVHLCEVRSNNGKCRKQDISGGGKILRWVGIRRG